MWSVSRDITTVMGFLVVTLTGRILSHPVSTEKILLKAAEKNTKLYKYTPTLARKFDLLADFSWGDYAALLTVSIYTICFREKPMMM